LKNKFIETVKSKLAFLTDSFKVRSIQFVISLSIMLITIISMTFIGVILYSKVSNLAEQNAIINTRQIIDQVNTNLDYYLRSMMEISNYLNEVIRNDAGISSTNLKDQMNVILNTRKDIVTLALFSSEGKLLAGVPFYKMKDDVDMTEQEWFKAPIKEPANLYFSSPHVENIYKGQHSWVVSLSRGVTVNQNGKKVKGVLLVDMNFSTIDQLCQKVNFGKKGYVYIIDSNYNIVYHPQQQLINVGLKKENLDDVREHVFGRYFDNYNGERRLITIETVNYCRWRIVGIAYMDEIAAIKKDIGNYILYLLVFGVLFVMSISAFVSAKISQPIKKLEKSMKMVEQGKFDINIDIKGEAEVAQLSKAFKLMVAKIKQLMSQIVLEQEAKRISELNALQAQINPHFLYNTLDSVVWMAENGKSEDVITMTVALARLFRISISRGRNIISVRQELEHAKNYLVIQSIRYKNKFKYEIEAQEEALKCSTIKLILQPIIENSIYHGIEYMPDQGFIKISVSIKDGKLLYKISDNGLGMDKQTLDSLLSGNVKSKNGSGVGVKNVHERIQLYYGKEYGLQIESELEVGTTVYIWLPLNRYENEGDFQNDKRK
jgi:two-component system sensor histidine kinase YesM